MTNEGLPYRIVNEGARIISGPRVLCDWRVSDGADDYPEFVIRSTDDDSEALKFATLADAQAVIALLAQFGMNTDRIVARRDTDIWPEPAPEMPVIEIREPDGRPVIRMTPVQLMMAMTFWPGSGMEELVIPPGTRLIAELAQGETRKRTAFVIPENPEEG